MGFLDKVKSQAEQAMKQGQDKVDSVQAKRRADGLLRDLGAWYYATETGRDKGTGSAELSRLVAELKAHEAEHGPLGGATGDADDTGRTSDAAGSAGKRPAPSNPVAPQGGPAPAFSPAPKPASPGSEPDPTPGSDPSTAPHPSPGSPDVDPVPPKIQPPPPAQAPEPPAVSPPGPDPDIPGEPSPIPSPPVPGTPSPPPPAPEVTPSPQPPAEVPAVTRPQPGGLPPMQAGDGAGPGAGD